MKISARNKILTEAQRALNRIAAKITAGEFSDPNGLILELNTAYGLIQTVKGSQ